MIGNMVSIERMRVLIKMAKANSENYDWMLKMSESSGISLSCNYHSDKLLWKDIVSALVELYERRQANEPMPARKTRTKCNVGKMKQTSSAKQRKLVKWIAETLKIEMPEEMTYENCNKFIRANKPAFDKVRMAYKQSVNVTVSEEPEGVVEQFEDPNQSPFQ